MKVEIKEAVYPRKATEYCVVVRSDEGKYLVCAHPYTPYKAQADLTAKAYRALIEHGGEQAIIDAMAELP